MRKGLFLAVVALLLVPAGAQAATALSEARAQQLARAEARDRANQESDGRDVQVGTCSRRSVRYLICRVSWRYTEEFDDRETVDCTERDQICSLEEEKTWKDAQRRCTASVKVQYVSPRRARAIAVLIGQRCTPFFERDGDDPDDPEPIDTPPAP